MFEVTMTAAEIATYTSPILAYEFTRNQLFALLDPNKEYITQTINFNGGFKSTAVERT